MEEIVYSEWGECEKCYSDAHLTRTGVCEKCMNRMLAIKSDPEERQRRLGQLNQQQNGIRMSIRRGLKYDTGQRPLPRRPFSKSRSEKLAEGRPNLNLNSDAAAQKFLDAKPEDFSATREEQLLSPHVFQLNRELMQYLTRHPEKMHELSPRQFEELIADILRDQGHKVQLTPQTRDGGYDIYATIRTPIGEVVVVVECKRWASKRKVDLQIVERFLHTIRDKVRASCGLIATTTTFSEDARKRAGEFEHQLKLADFKKIREWTANYGQWRTMEGRDLWVPESTGLLGAIDGE